MPTTSFDASGSLPGTLTRRRPGGLRVYLERPWFFSGEGELLGVLVRDEGSGAPESSYPFISVMGRDPIRVSATVSAPTASAFPSAATAAAGLPLPEPSDFTAGFTVTAVGYEPRFDRDAGRWFCDIDLDTGGAYFPFVRPALTRLPDSLPGDLLPQIVLTDNLRVLPERVLTVAGTDPLLVQLSGPNYTVPGGADTGVRPARARAFLQERDPELDDDAVAWFTLEDSASPLDRVDDVSLSASDYTGQLPLPGDGPDSGAAGRLLVVEEAVTVAYHPADPESGMQGSVVYMDTVDVESAHHDGPHPGPHGPHNGPHDGPHGPHDGPHGGPHGGSHGPHH
ncbi:hypothetical protein [Streptomyces arenae]|uniref:hypothetical protein n=1 Tax=Streptomyces arenae TaxID=29301 RepID=UPI00265A8B15|nr:hypothetical protein [Streptomyces arenae]MCG7205178.1 hypothetical protein [Streptomyces arenae]